MTMSKKVHCIINLIISIFIFPFFLLFKPKFKKIIIFGFGNDHYENNIRFLYEYYQNNFTCRYNIYAVFAKGSTDSGKINRTNLLYRGAIKTYLLFFIAKAVVFDTGANNDIAPGIQKFAFWVKRFYVTHGMEGLKYMDLKKRKYITADYTFTASEFERNIKKQYISKCKAIYVTGYPRFDYYSGIMKNLIIVFLTWRDYLNTEEKLLTSEYLSRLNKLIHDLRLVDILDKYDFTCYIKIHQEIKKIWTGHFNPSHRIITDQSIDFSDLMKHASILITDYSSIAWDFIFYDKPVIFYQFDKDTYEEKRGPLYVDVETQKLGLFIREHDDLVNSIESIIGNRSKSYRIPNKEKFFLYNDFENTKRVVSIIESII